MCSQTESGQAEPEVPPQEMDRRTFFTYIIAAVGAFVSAVVGTPVVGAFVLPALKRGESNLVSAGPVSNFPTGVPTATTVAITLQDGWIQSNEDKGIWVVKRSDNDFTVFSGRCTHLGCAYNWQETAKEFNCPCHGGRYSLDGVVMGGPPPRPLDTMGWKVEQGNLLVEYEDFRLGVPEKVRA